MKFVITQKQSEHSDFPEEDCRIGGYKTDALRLVWSRVCSMFSGTDKNSSFFSFCWWFYVNRAYCQPIRIFKMEGISVGHLVQPAEKAGIASTLDPIAQALVQ